MPNPTRLRRDLLAWYDANKRALPWRNTKDPYRIWVSEVMCQQTRVETVIPYYARFLEAFPTLRDLAKASEDDVLARWSGLGYYRRARLLHRGVQEVVAQHSAKVPRNAEARRKLPGIGRYTAGAIGSIAFALEEPIVDGNVARVLARHDGIDAPIGTKECERSLWARAGALVLGERPGDFNQALMELGATVCTPRSPSCERCPIRKTCVAAKQGEPERYPVPRTKKASPHVPLVAIALFNSRDELALQRGEGALFGGLWGLPMREGDDLGAAVELLEALDPKAALDREPLGTVTHVLSHRRLTILLYSAQATAKNSALSFFSEQAREKLGRSSLTEKLIALARPDQLSLPLRRRATIQNTRPSVSKRSPATRTTKSPTAPGRGSKA